MRLRDVPDGSSTTSEGIGMRNNVRRAAIKAAIKKAFGSQTNASKQLGISMAAISGWVSREKVPEDRLDILGLDADFAIKPSLSKRQAQTHQLVDVDSLPLSEARRIFLELYKVFGEPQ